MRFFGIVQDAAKKLGKVFFLWTEENNPLMTDELDGGDLSGWLVDAADAERFDTIWRESIDDIPDELDDTFCFASCATFFRLIFPITMAWSILRKQSPRSA